MLVFGWIQDCNKAGPQICCNIWCLEFKRWCLFSVLVQWITCKTSYCKQLGKSDSFILLLWNTVLEGKLFVTLEAQGLPVSWFITYFIWSPFLPAVLSALAQPCSAACRVSRIPQLLPRLQSLSRGRAMCQDRLLPAVGKILKCPCFCSWLLAYIFIKMLVFNLYVLLFACQYSCCLFKRHWGKQLCAASPWYKLARDGHQWMLQWYSTNASASLKVINFVYFFTSSHHCLASVYIIINFQTLHFTSPGHFWIFYAVSSTNFA